MFFEKDHYTEINNYGLIGNLKTVALVSMNGSIDFMCMPDFDSPTVFGALLDQDNGGCFAIKPKINHLRYRQLYLTDTAVLVTRFFSGQGMGELTDFMVVDEREGKLNLVRKVTTIRGDITYNLECGPRFNYGKDKPDARQAGNQIVFGHKNGQALYLYGSQPVKLKNDSAYADFELKPGESAWFFITGDEAPEQLKADAEKYGNTCYTETIDYWQRWIDQSGFKGRWIESIFRSAITLKLLTSYSEGSVIAAPTFGLPELIGGSRNWDYRYTWIRDASFTMSALIKLGFMDEATRYLNWLERYCLTGDMKLVYAYDGKTPPQEAEQKHLAGYRHSMPVLVGNNAREQKQLDIYGELLDTIYTYNLNGGIVTLQFWNKLIHHIAFVTQHWHEADHGIWEVRGGEKEFLHSRLMCWVAMDRAIKIAQKNQFECPAGWGGVQEAIRQDIHQNFWCAGKQTFTQHKNTTEVDATALLMLLVDFIAPNDPKWQGTLLAIERELKLDVLLYRYRETETDGIDGEEGTFTLCSFWYIECLAKLGQYQKASEHFAKIIGYGNPLRLFSEQLSKTGEQVGNFPQALTHLALINAGIELNNQYNLKTGRE